MTPGRRRIVLGIAGAAATFRAMAQAPQLRRVAVLAPSTREREEITLKPFFDEMRALGWIEGQTIEYDRAYADDRHASLDSLAVQLVARKPELIFAPPAPAAVSAKKATSRIPIVFATGTDPVVIGLVASLARPGGNVTGIVSVADSLAPKLVQILRELLPNAKRLGVLNEPIDPRARLDLDALGRAATPLGMTLVTATVPDAPSLRAAVAQLSAQKVDAIVTSTSLIFNLRASLLELADAARIPVAGHRSELADAGALFAYGAALADQMRVAARLADKVLKGSSPADLPVEQPTKFELVVNQRAAARLGIKVPASVLARADRVID